MEIEGEEVGARHRGGRVGGASSVDRIPAVENGLLNDPARSQRVLADNAESRSVASREAHYQGFGIVTAGCDSGAGAGDDHVAANANHHAGDGLRLQKIFQVDSDLAL